MPKLSDLRFLILMQVLVGFIIGPAVAFQWHHGDWAMLVFVALSFSLVLCYFFWMTEELKRTPLRFSSLKLRTGIIAAPILAMFITAVIFATVKSYEERKARTAEKEGYSSPYSTGDKSVPGDN